MKRFLRKRLYMKRFLAQMLFVKRCCKKCKIFDLEIVGKYWWCTLEGTS